MCLFVGIPGVQSLECHEVLMKILNVLLFSIQRPLIVLIISFKLNGFCANNAIIRDIANDPDLRLTPDIGEIK